MISSSNFHLRPHYLFIGILLVVAGLVYGGILGHQFIFNWDDSAYVVENEAVRGITLDHVRAAFSSFYVGNYAPVHIVSYMLDYSIWGLRPYGYLLTNLLLHAANGLLFYVLLVRLHLGKVGALFAALLFLVHPVQVETVAWVAERKNLLAMLFFLISLLLYTMYGDHGARQRRDGKIFYGASLAAFAMAVLSKSVAVVLLPTLLLYDICFLPAGEWRRRLIEKIPFLLIVVGTVIVTCISQAGESSGGMRTYHGGSPFVTFLTMLPVLAEYLRMLVWPSHLSVVYMPDLKQQVDGTVAGAAFLLILVSCAGVYLFRRQRPLFFWFALFWIGLVPVSQIIPIATLMNDRYLYFPLLGAAAMAGCGVTAGWSSTSTGKGKGLLLACAGLLVLSLAVAAQQRTDVWQDEISLWSDAAHKEPECHVAWFGLGDAQLSRGATEKGVQALNRALVIDPTYGNALHRLALFYMERGELLTARPYLQRLVSHWPGDINGLTALAANYYLAGDLPGAAVYYTQALALQPDSAPILTYLGHVNLGLRQLEPARRYYLDALKIGGSRGEIEYSLACVEALAGRPATAIDYLEAALADGFTDLVRIRSNRELVTLWGKPEFLALQGRIGREKGTVGAKGRK